MYKSRVFTFFNYNLDHDISSIGNSGRKIKELQCSCLTANIWFNAHINEFQSVIEADSINKKAIGLYKDIPIYLNHFLDDGVIGIETE